MKFLLKAETVEVLCDFLLFKGEGSREVKLKHSYQVHSMIASLNASPRVEIGVGFVDAAEKKRFCIGSMLGMVERLPDAFEPGFEGSLHHIMGVLDGWFAVNARIFYTILDQNPELWDRYINGLIKTLWFSRTQTVLTNFICPQEAELESKLDAKLRSGVHFFARLCAAISDRSETLKVRVGAAEFFPVILEKLSTSGGIVLELRDSPECIADLVKLLSSSDEPLELRQSVCKCIEIMVRMSRQPVVSVGMNPGTGKPILESCRLAACHDVLFKVLSDALEDLCNAPEMKDASSSGKTEIKYSSYAVRQPFTYCRYMIVKIVVAIAVDCDAEVLDKFPTDTVKKLCQWFLKYPHNNLFHTEFIKLFTHIIHQGNSDHALMKFMMQKCKILTKFIDALSTSLQLKDDPTTTDSSTRGTKAERLDVSGHILQLLKLIRDKANTLPQDSYLRGYLLSHDSWRSFQPHLDNALDVQALENESFPSMNGTNANNEPLALPVETGAEGENEELNGLAVEVEETSPTASPDGEGSPGRHKSRKGKNKKKKQRKGKSKSRR